MLFAYTRIQMKRIVLTGGPGAGKTVISARLADQHRDRFTRVPEAATQVYDALQTRWDRLDLAGRRDAQRQMYQLQVGQEQRIAREHPNQVLLLDRGTIDGAAYWPDGFDAFWEAMGTTHAQELARYDTVIWLETAAALGVYDGDASNSCRFEDADAAIASGEVLLKLWGDHPRLRKVPASAQLDDKLAAVWKLIGTELAT